MAERTGEPERIRQKKFRDKKREQGYVKLQAWVKHEHRNLIKKLIKLIHEHENI